MSYQSFVKLAGQPSSPLSHTLSSLPLVGDVGSCVISEVPTMKELGYVDIGQVWNKYHFTKKKKLFLEYFVRRRFMQDECSPFRGGESEALKRLNEIINDKVWCTAWALM